MLTEGSNCFVGLVFFHQLHKTRVCIDWIFKETSFTYDSVPERGRKDMKSPPNPLAALQAVSLLEEKELMMFLASSILSCPSWTLCLSQAQKLFYQWEELWGRSNKIVLPSGHPNYMSVVLLLTSWIKERCLSCCSSLTDPQGQPKSTSWLAGPTSISSWLHDFLLQTEMVFLHSFFLTFYQQLSQSSVAYNITSGKNKNCFVQLKQYFCKLFINMSFSLSGCK